MTHSAPVHACYLPPAGETRLIEMLPPGASEMDTVDEVPVAVTTFADRIG
jgi:hypothetical protein